VELCIARPPAPFGISGLAPEYLPAVNMQSIVHPVSVGKWVVFPAQAGFPISASLPKAVDCQHGELDTHNGPNHP